MDWSFREIFFKQDSCWKGGESHYFHHKVYLNPQYFPTFLFPSLLHRRGRTMTRLVTMDCSNTDIEVTIRGIVTTSVLGRQ